MTDPKDIQPPKTPNLRGEVLISGLDTGPSETERQNRSPTVKLMGLQPETTQEEPEDEDG